MTSARPLVQLLAAVVLFVAASASWYVAGRARGQAQVHHRVATLQEQSDYWTGRYDSASRGAAASSAEMLIAANAAFRKAQRAGSTVDLLDQAAQAYASVLRNGGFDRDAAFNYEYVARLRDTIAKTKNRPPRPAVPQPSDTRDDLPSGTTIHGQPGMHPPATRGEEFEVLTPMDYGEREAQPEPTPGRPLPRKG